MEITLDVCKKDCFGIGQNIVVAVTPVLTEEELSQQWKDFRNLLIHDYQIESLLVGTSIFFMLFQTKT